MDKVGNVLLVSNGGVCVVLYLMNVSFPMLISCLVSFPDLHKKLEFSSTNGVGAYP